MASTNPHIYHWREESRVVTMAWDYNNGVLRYGATVWHRTKRADTWNRKDHLDTAVSNFYRLPVYVKVCHFWTKETKASEETEEVDIVYTDGIEAKWRKALRSLLFIHGTCSRGRKSDRLKVDSFSTVSTVRHI